MKHDELLIRLNSILALVELHKPDGVTKPWCIECSKTQQITYPCSIIEAIQVEHLTENVPVNE